MTSLSSTINSIIVGSSITEAIELLIEGLIKDQIDSIERLMALFKKASTQGSAPTPIQSYVRSSAQKYKGATMTARRSSSCRNCPKRIAAGSTIVNLKKGRGKYSKWVCEKCGTNPTTGISVLPPLNPSGFAALVVNSAKKAVDGLDSEAGTVVSRLAMGGVNPTSLKKFIAAIEKARALHFPSNTSISAEFENLKKLLLS